MSVLSKMRARRVEITDAESSNGAQIASTHKPLIDQPYGASFTQLPIRSSQNRSNRQATPIERPQPNSLAFLSIRDRSLPIACRPIQHPLTDRLNSPFIPCFSNQGPIARANPLVYSRSTIVTNPIQLANISYYDRSTS